MTGDCSVLNGIVIGGALAGITVYLAAYIHDTIRESREKGRVCEWMDNFIRTNREGIGYLSTRNIASHNNLTEDRARYICSIHDKIYLSTGEKEDMWGLKELSGRT